MSFFYGWRRKAGMVSLGLVCALMLLWIRSRVIVDTAMFSVRLRTVVILSKPDQVTFVAYYNGSGLDWQIDSMSIRDFDNDKFDGLVEEMRRVIREQSLRASPTGCPPYPSLLSPRT